MCGLLRLNLSSVALIVGNLVPIIGVLFFSWELFPVVLLYWLENIVIGIFNAVKMLTCADAQGFFKRIFTTAFFSVHYGLFCLVHGVFLVDLFGGKGNSLEQVPMMILANGLKWALLALIISHAFSLLSNYYLRGEYKRLSVSDVMFMPYKRIIVLHVFIILGAMVLQSFGVTQSGLIALAVIKILADLIAHNMEHKKSYNY